MVVRSNQITLSYDKITQEYIRIYGKESLLILAILSRSYTIRKELVFSMKYLLDVLNIALNKRDRKIDIINCINKMMDCNINHDVEIYKQMFVPYYINPSQYIIITDEEVDIVLNYNRRIDKFNLFNTYATIKRFVNHKTGTAFPSTSTIMNITNVVSNKTTLNYIKVLEELDLIECIKGDNYIITPTGIRKPNNVYKLVKCE